MKRWVNSLALSTFAVMTACTGSESGHAGDAEEATTAAEETATDCSGGTSNTIVMSTSMGDITIELYPEEAPITVENFVEYVESCFFDNTIIHRVAAGFVLQGGGYGSGMQRKETRPPITNEADNGLLNERGTLSMARTSDINSATSQFFINLVDNNVLNHGVRDFGYAVFARVTDGMDVVDAIGSVPVNGERPREEVLIRSVRRQ